MNTQHGNGFTDGDREAVLETLATEQRLKHEGKPYSEAVILACEICLRANPRKPHLYQVPHELPVEQDQGERPRPKFWWNKDD
jgi:hypothetical protein